MTYHHLLSCRQARSIVRGAIGCHGALLDLTMARTAVEATRFADDRWHPPLIF